MINFFTDFLLIILGAFAGGASAGLLIIHQIKKNFYRPKLYFKNVQIVPTKGDVVGEKFKWGGLVFTGELCNDSDHWAYNVRIHDIYAEFLPNSNVVLLKKVPLRLATDLPRLDNYKYFQNNTQLQNIKPGDKITTSIRVLTKQEISLTEYKLLIKELKMIQIRTRLIYENAAGFKSGTYFWLDFQYGRFVNIFGRSLANNYQWKNGMEEGKSKLTIKSKIIEIEAEPF
ncbi:MAG: hypothetical protein HC819_05700 [Cyclobacteriaceae bacterium]|nr:hypothetical protein [Cyclobacteriaceae bacterium]